MIALGVRGGSEVCADIAALGGLGLTGPGAPAAARAILAGLLARAVPGQPGGPAEVIMPAADTALLLPGWTTATTSAGRGIPGLVITPSLDAALDQAEALVVRRARLSGVPDTGDDPPGDRRRAAVRGGADRVPVPGQRRRGWPRCSNPAGPPAWPRSCSATGHRAPPAMSPPTARMTSADPALDGIQLFHLGDADTAAVISLLREACGTPVGAHYPAPVPGGFPLPEPATAGSQNRQRVIPADPGTTRPARSTGLPTERIPPPGAGQPHPGASSPAPEQPRPARDPARPKQAAPAPQAPAERVIRVEVLGPLRITARGQEIRGGLRKARELAAFLAVHPDGVTGEAISEALWPESPPGHGASRRNLALRKLRDLLRAAAGLTEPMLITLAAGRYRLDPAFVSTDVADFQAALETARHAGNDPARLAACQQAAALYRGPLADGAGYEWAEPYAETARRRALDAWTRIAELLEPAGPDQALAALETALGHDPFNEYLYQRIMRLQAAAGRPDAVRRTLRLLETRLSELGVTPGPQTRQAAAALLGMPVPPARGGGPQPPAPPRPAPAARQRPPGRQPAR